VGRGAAVDAQPPRVELRLFGGLELFRDGVCLRFSTKRAAALFVYLLLNSGRRTHRDRLLGVLWPDVEEERGRRNLSTALWRVKRRLSDAPGFSVLVDGPYMSVEAKSVWVDVIEFRRLLAEADRTSGERQIALLREAEALYRGEFLEGFLDDEWCEDERRSFRVSYLRLLRKLADASRSASEHAVAIGYLEKIVSLDPLDEGAHRELIALHYISGNRTAALVQFERVKQVLESELGVPPSKETLELRDYVLRHSSRGGSRPERARLPGLAGSDLPINSQELPTVGRGLQLQLVQLRLDSALQGRGSGLVVCGDAGIGKSKFVEDVVREAQIRRFEVLFGKCPDVGSALPYQVMVQALWPRISRLPDPLDRTSKVIQALVDTLSSVSASRGADRRVIASLDSALLGECVLSLLDEPLNHGPTMLVLEDIHHVDKATERLVMSLLARVANRRLVVVTTVRTEGTRGEELVSGLATNGAEVLRLGSLSEADSKALTRSALGVDVVPTGLLEFVWRRSGGIPLFTLELLRFLMDEGAVRWTDRGKLVFDEGRLSTSSSKVPWKMYEIIRRRIESLRVRDRGILIAAAILGFEVDYALLEQFVGTAGDRFLDSVERIIAARLLVESDRGLRFPHESIRLAALSVPSRARLRRLHLRAAQLIQDTMPSRISDLAWHYLEAGEVERALIYYEESGDRAMLVHANEDALRCYTNAVRVADSFYASDPASLKKRAVLRLKRQEVLDLMGDRTSQSNDIEAALSIADQLRDNDLKAQAVFLQSQVLCRMNSNDRALAAARQAEALFLETGNEAGAAKACEAMGVVHTYLRDQAEAGEAFRRALFLFRRVRDRSGIARALVNLGTVMCFSGRNSKALRYLEQAESLLTELNDERSLAGALLQKGILLRILGRGRESESLLQKGIEILHKIGDNVGQGRGLTQLSYTHAALGRLNEALHESKRAVQLARQARDVRAQIMFLNNAAYSVFRSLGLFWKAQKCVSTCIRLVAEEGQAENAAIYHDTMASILLEKGDYEGALRWAKQAKSLYRRWKGHFGYVGAEIDFRLGLTYLYLRRPKQAASILERVTSKWKRRGDLTLLAHGVAALARAYSDQGKLEKSVECAREVERILRSTDCVEQIQKVYWDQYRVFQRAQSYSAARRALRRAFRAVVMQAAPLKGLFRNRFITSVVVNREILAEVAQRQRRAFDQPQECMHSLATWFALDGRTMRITKRRKALLDLMRVSVVKQRELAVRLGVSVRTVRNDLSALRSQGLIGSEPHVAHT